MTLDDPVESFNDCETLSAFKYSPPSSFKPEETKEIADNQECKIKPQEGVKARKSLAERLKAHRRRAKERQFFICPFCKHDYSSKHELVS